MLKSYKTVKEHDKDNTSDTILGDSVLRESQKNIGITEKNKGITYKCFSIRILGILIALFVIFFDQASKWLVTETLEYAETVSVSPSFALTLRHNTGAAFSFLAEAAGWQRWFFVGVAAVVSSIIFVWLGRLSSQEKLEGLGLSLILGGALGNVIDRLFHGYVVDFILLYYHEWQYPAFNIADMAISLGVFFFVLGMLKKKK